MTDFQSAFDQTTENINTTLSTQLSSVLTWANIPGSLTKVSSSALGYAWGYSGSDVFICILPCSGNWLPVDLAKFNISTIQDLVCDESTVYILASSGGNDVMIMNSADNRGVWNMISVPFSATQIFSTHSYIWAQDGQNNKRKCPKPCTMNNWIAEPENKITITSSSSSSLYGKDPSGLGMKTDETLQSGWTPITGLLGMKVNSVIGQVDESSLYALDQTSKLSRCEGNCEDLKDVAPVDTQGFIPSNVSAEPISKQLWMTSTLPGDKGNIFNRVDKPDYSTIMNIITTLDKQRDTIIGDVSKEYNNQTNIMSINKELSDIQSLFQKTFSKTSQSASSNKDNINKLQEIISEKQGQLDQITDIEPYLKGFVTTLAVVAGIYLLGSFLGSFIHFIALIVLGAGIYYTINNGFSGFPSLWSGMSKTT